MFFQPGHEIIVGKCSQKCSCVDGELICEFVSCDNNSYCITKSGVEQCSCKDGYEGDGVYCETKGEKNNCIQILVQGTD